MKENFTSEEKMQIMRFICTFAWADLKVVPSEKLMIERFCNTLQLDENQRKEVNSWTKRPIHPEDIDPFSIPDHLKKYILSAAKAISIVDGDFDEKEAELLELLQNLLT